MKKDNGTPWCEQMHKNEEVQVGPYKIWAGGAAFFRDGDLEDFDLIIPLAKEELPMLFGKQYQVLCAYIEGKFQEGELAKIWSDFVRRVIFELSLKKKISIFCFRGHGRTGLLLASLVALLESKEETPDPIAAVRERYCKRAVECRYQARLIFALRGEEPPEQYKTVKGIYGE